MGAMIRCVPAFVAAWTAAVLFVIGCGAPRPAPVSAVRAYGRALDARDYARAYRRMSAAFRDTYTEQEYTQILRDSDADIRQTAARLRAEPRTLDRTARLVYGAADAVELVYEGGAWRIASNPWVFYSQATPRDALRSFLRAYQLRRWDVMRRLIPDGYAEDMTTQDVKRQFMGTRREEMAMMMSLLEASVDAPIQHKGVEARLPYSEAEVLFVRERGMWKIKEAGRRNSP